MEFLFLNEEANIDTGSLEGMNKFAEENGVTCFDEDTTLEEAMVETMEAMHEAEMQAMTSEFALYQESVLNEGVKDMASAAWSKLKEWWNTIKNWIIKIWQKIVHWFWVAVQWCRKTYQAAIQKLHGKTTIHVAKCLMGDTIKGIQDKLAAALKEKENSTSKEFDKEGKKGIKKEIKDAWADIKKAYKEDKKNGNAEEIPFATWKTKMDKALADFEAAKKASDEANKNAKQAVKDADAAFTKGYKEGDATGNAALKAKCVGARNHSLICAKNSAFSCKVARWYMGALLHGASYKAKEAKKD